MACPPGSYLNVSACAMLRAGNPSQPPRARRVCPPCPPSTIAASFASTSCDARPASSADAFGHTACVCADGYYDALLGANSSAPACESCADGGACVGGQLLAQEGYWRESPNDAILPQMPP
jgi:hypothetical protein